MRLSNAPPVVAIGFGLMSMVGCGPKVDHYAEVYALMQKDREWADVAERGDLDRLWGFWADDAVWYQGDRALRGLDEIKEFATKSRSFPE